MKFILYRTLENAPDSDDSAGSVNVNSINSVNLDMNRLEIGFENQ